MAVYSENGVRILSIVFGEQWTEISYVEEKDDTDDVVDVRQRLIGPHLFTDEVEELKESIEELLDKAALHRRNPAQTFTR